MSTPLADQLVDARHVFSEKFWRRRRRFPRWFAVAWILPLAIDLAMAFGSPDGKATLVDLLLGRVAPTTDGDRLAYVAAVATVLWLFFTLHLAANAARFAIAAIRASRPLAPASPAAPPLCRRCRAELDGETLVRRCARCGADHVANRDVASAAVRAPAIRKLQRRAERRLAWLLPATLLGPIAVLVGSAIVTAIAPPSPWMWLAPFALGGFAAVNLMRFWPALSAFASVVEHAAPPRLAPTVTAPSPQPAPTPSPHAVPSAPARAPAPVVVAENAAPHGAAPSRHPAPSAHAPTPSPRVAVAVAAPAPSPAPAIARVTGNVPARLEYAVAKCIACGGEMPLHLVGTLVCPYCGAQDQVPWETRTLLERTRGRLAARARRLEQFVDQERAGSGLHGLWNVVGAVVRGFAGSALFILLGLALVGFVAFIATAASAGDLPDSVSWWQVVSLAAPKGTPGAWEVWDVFYLMLWVPVIALALPALVSIPVGGPKAPDPRPLEPLCPGAPPRCRCCLAELPPTGTIRRCQYCGADHLVLGEDYRRSEATLDAELARVTRHGGLTLPSAVEGLVTASAFAPILMIPGNLLFIAVATILVPHVEPSAAHYKLLVFGAVAALASYPVVLFWRWLADFPARRMYAKARRAPEWQELQKSAPVERDGPVDDDDSKSELRWQHAARGLPVFGLLILPLALFSLSQIAHQHRVEARVVSVACHYAGKKKCAPTVAFALAGRATTVVGPPQWDESLKVGDTVGVDATVDPPAVEVDADFFTWLGATFLSVLALLGFAGGFYAAFGRDWSSDHQTALVSLVLAVSCGALCAANVLDHRMAWTATGWAGVVVFGIAAPVLLVFGVVCAVQPRKRPA